MEKTTTLKMSSEELNNYVIVTEDMILSGIKRYYDAYGNSVNSVFISAYEAGQQYKLAGLTPMYIVDPETSNIGVTAYEMFGQTIH
jgi:hypothetical protein